MLIWLNGTFGVGKTTVARHLCALGPGLRLFDAELVGYMLHALLPDVPHADFQDLPPWRALVPKTASAVSTLTGSHLVVVQTVLRREYWAELQEGLAAEGLQTASVLLHCDSEELRRRARDDQDEPTAKDWRLTHIEAYEQASEWMKGAADVVVDTTRATPGDVAATVWASVSQRIAADRV